MKVYKIKDKVTGLFSTGGATPQFSKTGKTWSNIGHLKSHIKQTKHSYYDGMNRKGERIHYDIPNTEIIEVEIVETATNVIPLEDMLMDMGMVDNSPLKRAARRYKKNES